MSSLPLSPAGLASAYSPQTFTVTIPLGVAFVLVVPSDPSRILLTMKSLTVTTFAVYPYGLAWQNAQWPLLGQTGGASPTVPTPTVWTYHDYGPIVGMPWYCITSGQQGTIAGITMSYDPGLIGLDQAARSASAVLPQPLSSVVPPLPVGQPLMLNPALQLSYLAEQKQRRQAARLQLPPYKGT